MKSRALLVLLAVVVAAVGSVWLGRPAPRAEAPITPAPPAALADTNSGASLVVHDVTVRDVDGRVAWRGDVDLAPVVARIEAGDRDEHRNDGAIFRNRERLLPIRPDGYYREYVVRTPGIGHAGPQRLVAGSSGELFYTADHYASFQRIR